MNILSLSDEVHTSLYSQGAGERFPNVDVIIGCGDLPYYYLDYVTTVLQTFLFYVRGNHGNLPEHTADGRELMAPIGGTDLHRGTANHNGVLLAGVEGCLRYGKGAFQYTEGEMWLSVLSLVPKLLRNRMRYGRFLDVFVTHAPPWGIHDREDRAHHGVKAFRWLLKTFGPALHLHGHVRPLRRDEPTETFLGKTLVVNTYGYRMMQFDRESRQFSVSPRRW